MKDYCDECRFLEKYSDAEEFWGATCFRDYYECDRGCYSPADSYCYYHDEWLAEQEEEEQT